MGGWLPSWAWWPVGLALAVTTGYLVLSNAIELLIRRWARRFGCPVCGCGQLGHGADRGQAQAEVSGEVGGG
jgi:hypothetical protein